MQNLLTQLADSLASATTLEDLTRPLLEMLETVTGLESTYLTMIDEGEGLQHVVYARNVRKLQVLEGLALPWEDTLCKRALEEGRAYTDDVGTYWGDSDAARALGIRTYASTPVLLGDGELYGTLCAASSETVPLSDNAAKVLGMFARLIGQHIERERLVAHLQLANAQLAASARTDPLTTLPNRRALFEELGRTLARARRDGTRLAVAFLDLDGFKVINDTYGHDSGDELLAELARRIRASRRASDLVARVGGDEFVVIAPISGDPQHAAQTLKASLAQASRGRFRIGGHDLDYGGASVGVVIAGADATSPQALISQADEAMYADKRARAHHAAA